MRNLKQNFYFTGNCFSLDEHPGFREHLILQLKAGELPWDQLLPLWSEHLVMPTLYLRFRDHNLLNLLPPEIDCLLQTIYQLNYKRNIRILEQIKRIVPALHNNKIYPIFLKGTGNLLDGLYTDIGERMIHDIDFLVLEQDYQRTVVILKGLGYSSNHHDYIDYMTLKHYPCLFKKSEPAVVEIHRLPVPAKWTNSINSSQMFKDRKTVAGYPGLYVPSDFHKLLHTFVHSQLADRGHGYKQSTFRGFNDLYRLSKRIEPSTLPLNTPNSHQAIEWLTFSQGVLGLPGRFYSPETRLTRWYSMKYNLSLSHPRSYNVYRLFKKLIYLILVRYILGLLRAIFINPERAYVYRRLKDLRWYKAHLVSYYDYFS